MNIADITITSVESVTVFDRVSGEVFLTVNELKDTTPLIDRETIDIVNGSEEMGEVRNVKER